MLNEVKHLVFTFGNRRFFGRSLPSNEVKGPQNDKLPGLSTVYAIVNKQARVLRKGALVYWIFFEAFAGWRKTSWRERTAQSATLLAKVVNQRINTANAGG